MAMAKITSKGQVTIPLSVRRELDLRSGSIVEFTPTGDGRVILEPVHASLAALEGILRPVAGGSPVSVGDMNRAIAAEAGGVSGSAS